MILENYVFKEREGCSNMVYKKGFGESKNGHFILVHGLVEHFRRHYRLINRLKENGFKIHAFDWFDHGKSPRKRGHARIDEIVNDID